MCAQNEHTRGGRGEVSVWREGQRETGTEKARETGRGRKDLKGLGGGQKGLKNKGLDGGAKGALKNGLDGRQNELKQRLGFGSK